MIVPDKMPPKFKHGNVGVLSWLQGVPNPEWIMATAIAKNDFAIASRIVEQKQNIDITSMISSGMMTGIAAALSILDREVPIEVMTGVVGAIFFKKAADVLIGDRVKGKLPGLWRSMQ